MPQIIKRLCMVMLMLVCICFCGMKSYAVEATLEQLEYTNENGIVTVEGYTGGSANIDLGALFPDAKEIIIENWAFHGSNITGIDLSQTVTSIGTHAFYETNITSITIPKTVSSIGELAFCNCENLQTVTFEERTTETITFGVSAFQGCANLLGLDLPDTVTNIPDQFCYDCKALTSVELPENCSVIGDEAFESCNLVDITIPENCQSLGEMVFYDCTSLHMVIFENPNTSIGVDAFPSTEDAKNLVIYCEGSGTVTVYATTYNIQYSIMATSIVITQYPEQREYFCAEQGELELGGMKITATYADGENTRQEEVSLEDCTFSAFDSNRVGEQIITVTHSGRTTTFTVMVYYNLADVVIEIDDAIYTGGRVEPYLSVMDSRVDTVLIKNKDYVVTFFENVNAGIATAKITGIGLYKGEKNIQFRVLPRTITEANVNIVVEDMNYTGQQLKPLPVVSCGTDTLILNKDYVISYGTNVAVGTGTLVIEGVGNYNGKIQKVFRINAIAEEKPDTSTTEEKGLSVAETPQIGQNHTYKNLCYKVSDEESVTFMYPVDKKIKKITIPNKVEILGQSFKVTQINQKACYNCKKLTTVIIGDNVTTIGDQAFAKCGKLKKVTIGKGLKKIGKKVFYKDKKLSKLIIKSSKLTSVGKGTLKGVKKVTVQAPKKKVTKYKKLFAK